MTAGTVRRALTLAERTRPDAALLDVMLPDGDGRALGRELRERQPDLALVFLTARDAPAEIVGALGFGDDYITKPFNIDEVVARITAVLRRTRPADVLPQRPPLRYGDLELDETTYSVHRALREPAQRKRAWDRMNGEADRMGRLVDELLTLARLDQQPELRFKNVDLSRLVRDAAEDLRAQQPDRPVKVDADGALLVQADESGLRQVLGNLVGNIRTHTPADVPATLALQRQDGVVRLCVADEGPGLAEEDAARIFDRFFRAGDGAGSGLGMAIVQGVVTAHGGEVAVRTAPGKGLAVTVTLPGRTGG